MTTTADALTAIRNEDLDALTAALDTGADVNAVDVYGYTLLTHSVYRNRLDMVDVLLSRGAIVHLKAHDGQTALHYAVFERRSDVFPAIFSAAGPLAMNFPDCDGFTPLHFLASFGSAEQIAFALSYPGIDTSIRNSEGHTPLEVPGRFLAALQTYRDQEARWQPMRYTWIKFLMIPTRR
jgi:ankyrin repeat protein